MPTPSHAHTFPFPGPYDDVVSLGSTCQPAHQLRRCLGLSHAQVFDWLVTTDPGILQLVDSGLDGFFQPGTLAPNAKGVIVDARTDTRFLHDFPAGQPFDTAHAKAAPRMAALVQRWRDLAASDRRVLFIREHFWTGQPVRQADLLHDALRRAAPRLCFRLLYLTRPDVHPLPPDRPDLLHRPLAPPDPPDWRGDNAAWQALFDTCLALPPPPGPAAA